MLSMTTYNVDNDNIPPRRPAGGAGPRRVQATGKERAFGPQSARGRAQGRGLAQCSLSPLSRPRKPAGGDRRGGFRDAGRTPEGAGRPQEGGGLRAVRDRKPAALSPDVSGRRGGD